MGRRMMLDDTDKYEKGLLRGGTNDYWQEQLSQTEIRKGSEWRTELIVRKFMVQLPEPLGPKLAYLMPFYGPLPRAVHGLRDMVNSGAYSDFIDEPTAMLRAIGRADLVPVYTKLFPPVQVEWLGQILKDLELDYAGGRTDPARQLVQPSQENGEYTEDELRHNWATKEFMTFHGLLVRLYTVFSNAMIFWPNNNQLHAKAYKMAMRTAYRFTQYHIDEWEMSLRVRMSEVDVHVPSSDLPIKARYQLPKAIRLRFLLTEVLECPFAAFFRTRACFPPLTVRGAREAVATSMRQLNGGAGEVDVDFVALDDLVRKSDAYGYGYDDPWVEAKRDIGMCFLAASIWFGSRAGQVAAALPPSSGGWKHPAIDNTEGAVSNRTLEEFAALCTAIFVEGWVAPEGGRQAHEAVRGRPTQLGRLALLARLDDYGVKPAVPGSERAAELPDMPEDWLDTAEVNAFQPAQRQIARLFELLDEYNRKRFGNWLVQEVSAERLQGEVSRDGLTLVMDPNVFGWPEVRKAFRALAISIGVELAERTREDGRSEKLWATSEALPPPPAVATVIERQLGLLDPEDRAFRILALAWTDHEELKLGVAGLAVIEKQTDKEQAALAVKRLYPEPRDERYGGHADNRRLTMPDR